MLNFALACLIHTNTLNRNGFGLIIRIVSVFVCHEAGTNELEEYTICYEAHRTNVITWWLRRKTRFFRKVQQKNNKRWTTSSSPSSSSSSSELQFAHVNTSDKLCIELPPPSRIIKMSHDRRGALKIYTLCARTMHSVSVFLSCCILFIVRSCELFSRLAAAADNARESWC